jgi:hypothetical protein
MKIWKRAMKLREDLIKASLDARDVGEHELSSALDRASSELQHPSVTNLEDRVDAKG